MKRTFFVGVLMTGAITALRAQITTPTTMDGYPPPGAPPIVTLLSPGAAPRSALRFAVKPSSSDEFEITMQMTMAPAMEGMALPEMKMPAITIGANVVVTDIASSGDIAFRLTIKDMKIDEGADPAIAAAMRGVASHFTPFAMTSVISPRGVTRTAALDIDAAADPQMRAMLGQFINQAQSLSIPFPEEMVGVGARWEVRVAVSTPVIQAFQKAEYELVSVDEQTATLSIKVEQSAPAQPTSVPGLPVPGDLKLVNHVGSGTGNTSIRFDRLIPTGTVSIDSTTTMELSMSGQAHAMTMKMSTKMSTRPKQ